MKEKTVLITGGTSGIGFQTAKGLARMGATVLISGRDVQRGETAAEEIRKETGSDARFLAADASTIAGNRDLAAKVRNVTSRLDVLINNVGGLYAERWQTADGIEATLAMNLIGPFVLTNELLPLLRSSAPSRIVIVSSGAHKAARPDFSDLQSEKNYLGFRAYAGPSC